MLFLFYLQLLFLVRLLESLEVVSISVPDITASSSPILSPLIEGRADNNAKNGSQYD